MIHVFLGGKDYLSQKGIEPLISILVVCYNNQQYIFETLRSIFDQTYPNIEILIGDDASEKFNAESLINWINQYRTGNIKKVAIFENRKNVGTVANIENLQQKSSGEFLLQIAADDALYDATVIEAAYRKAVEIGDHAEMIVGQTELWDVGLKTKLGDFIPPEVAAFLKDASPEEVFAECSYHVILPACYLYRRTILDKIGKLSDQYRLVEDWPMHLRATRQGIKPYYLDGVTFLKHRDGGISHGNLVQSKKMFLTYYEDILKLYPYEVQPYESALSKEERERAEKYYRDRIRAYYAIHIPNYQNAVLAAENQGNVLDQPAPKKDKPASAQIGMAHEGSNGTRKQKIKRLIKDTMYRYSRKKVVLFTFCCLILLFCMAIVTGALTGEIWHGFGRALVVICAIVGLALAAEIAANVLLRIWRKVRERHG